MSSANYVTVQFHIFESTCTMFNCKIPLIPANYLFSIFLYIVHTEKKKKFSLLHFCMKYKFCHLVSLQVEALKFLLNKCYCHTFIILALISTEFMYSERLRNLIKIIVHLVPQKLYWSILKSTLYHF